MTENSNSTREFDLAAPVGSFTSTVRNVLLVPRDFFRGIAVRGSLKNPLIFGLACLLVSGLLGSLINLLNVPGSESWITGNALTERVGNIGLGETVVLALLGVIIAPLSALIRLYLYSGIVHLLVMVLMAQRRDFEATLRTYCYASAVALFSWIPLVGWLATLYGLYVLVVGLQGVHGDRTAATTARS